MSKSYIKLLLGIILLVIVSIFLIHIFAFFGVFIAIAFPLWWIFMPKQTPCFLCRAMAEGDKCPFCQRIIAKNEQVEPRNLKSAIANGSLILFFSIVSAILIYGESKLLINLGIFVPAKTVSFVIPTKGQYRLGEVFPMKIEIAGNKTQINAIQADIGFEPTKLEVQNVTTEGSFADIFIQKEINNEGGYIRLTGGLASPGFSGDRGTFGTVYFKGMVPGLVTVSYLPSSKVLANDKKGSNVLNNLASISYLILPEKITPEEERSQKTIDLTSSVLGETTNESQMIFYEEDGQVLGNKSIDQTAEKAKISVFSTLVNFLDTIDQAILKLWGNILKVFVK